MTSGTWKAKIAKAIQGRNDVPQSQDAPESFSISYDALRLVLANYVAAQDGAMRWTGYSGLALSLWASLVVSDFSFKASKFGLVGSQWEIIFFIAAILSTIRAAVGFMKFLQRPSADSLLVEILSRADVAQEYRAICLLKYRGTDHEYRILVYRDALWDCYLLPHYNMLNVIMKDLDDPNLRDFIAGEIGIAPSELTVERIVGADLRSRKHSEFWRQGTIYRFTFFLVELRNKGSLPQGLRQKSFTHNGREFFWLTLSEMEADPNTRNRNLDVTRHISDRATQLLRQTPDSILLERHFWAYRFPRCVIERDGNTWVRMSYSTGRYPAPYRNVTSCLSRPDAMQDACFVRLPNIVLLSQTRQWKFPHWALSLTLSRMPEQIVSRSPVAANPQFILRSLKS